MIKPMKGPAKLTYDDGFSLDVEADVRFQSNGGTVSGVGTIRHEKALMLGMKEGQPILECAGQRYRVHVRQARADGSASVMTSGRPIT